MAVIGWQHGWPGRRLAGLVMGVAVAVALIVPVARMAQVSAAAEPCVVSYQVNQWTGGFTAQIGLTNNGAALSGWTLTWTFDGNQQITSAWNAQITQSGATVQAINVAYDGSLATGATVSFGFQGTFSGTNDIPTDFAVNGVACNGGSPSPSPTPTPTPTPSTTTGPCSATVFCDSFENQAGTVPSGRWSVLTPDCSGTGTASVDSTVAHTGSKSVRVAGGASYCNHVFIADSADMPTAGPDLFVRFWVMHTTPLPTGHVTFLAMNDSANGNTSLRLGGQNGALMWNRQSDDATLPDQSPAGVAQSALLPVNTWACIEFEVNSANGFINTWVNGTNVPGLTEDGVPTPDIDDQWLAKPGWRPHLTDLRLGWESYASETDTLWFDDVALSSARIGCA
ncbi:MAG TPA: cellulose-binding domain-containing protein [Streptosporangiaceae bacterium]